MNQSARPESIALIDLSYLFKKRYHTINDGGRNAAAEATLRDLENLKTGVGHVVLCLDAGPYVHRLEVFKDYKANRPVPEPEERAQKRWLNTEVKRLGYNAAWVQGYEADDIIATLAREYSEWCDDVRIVGPDKDAAQCLNEHVTQYIPPVGDRDWEVRDVKAATEKFKVPPHLMTFYQGLVGDKGDNIPGVPGIGEVKAAYLANKYLTVAKLAEGLATSGAAGEKPSTVKALAENWDALVMSVKLATLDSHVPLDADDFLIPRPEQAPAKKDDSMDITRNETPMPPAQDGVSGELLEEAGRLYREKLPELKAVKDGELLEQESDRERERNEEHDAVSNAPGEKQAEKVRTPRERSTALATAPTVTQSRYGLVTADLQPIDLEAAYTVSDWLCRSGVYGKSFKNAAQIFAIIARGKELGIGMTTALAGHHMVEGKPAASADLIRALAERDPNFEYLMPIEMSATKVVWEGKHKKQPRPVVYTYTIEEAEQAGLVRLGSYAGKGNWYTRPQDMLMKTAGSKLARLLWPGATMGLYCPEEMGFTAEELEAREAA